MAVREREPDDLQSIFSDDISAFFSSHVQHLKKRRKQRLSLLALKTVVESQETALIENNQDDDTLFEDSQPLVIPTSVNNVDDDTALNVATLPSDEFEGDLVLRRLQILLNRVDERGYLRSRQQVRFHDAFIRATSRVIYKSDWSSSRPRIVEKNGWEKTPSEILISTPRRFGKVRTALGRGRRGETEPSMRNHPCGIYIFAYGHFSTGNHTIRLRACIRRFCGPSFLPFYPFPGRRARRDPRADLLDRHLLLLARALQGPRNRRFQSRPSRFSETLGENGRVRIAPS